MITALLPHGFRQEHGEADVAVHGEGASYPAFGAQGHRISVLGPMSAPPQAVPVERGGSGISRRNPLGQHPTLRRGGAAAIQLVLRLDGWATAALLARSARLSPCRRRTLSSFVLEIVQLLLRVPTFGLADVAAMLDLHKRLDLSTTGRGIGVVIRVLWPYLWD